MRFWLAMVGMTVALGISFLVFLKKRSANVMVRDEGREIAKSEVVSEPRYSKRDKSSNVDMQVTSPNSAEAEEELPVELDKILAGG